MAGTSQRRMDKREHRAAVLFVLADARFSTNANHRPVGSRASGAIKVVDDGIRNNLAKLPIELGAK